MTRTNDPSSAAGHATLVAGLVAAPLAWSLQLQLSYVLATFACGRSVLAVHLVSLAALAVAVGSTIVSWRGWAPLRDARREDLDPALRRTRFLSLLGVYAGGLFVLAILALWIPALVLDPCD